ncbi:unnamed protein product [Leptosia nina]|uniref:Carboxylic ester hydrolase n=1 Tax=Leptosia nina TaxID=320188 RepID=A0AAV1JYD0_9NEOP
MPLKWILVLIPAALCQLRLDPLVDTKAGLIKGLRADDGDYSMFLGVPYGKVDENNPFGLSQPYVKFNGTFVASNDSAICPQIEEFNNTVVGDLDCLHLNIYVPNSATSRNQLPVLVWIYGGGFRIGFAGRYLYGPKFIVRHDVILVTVNYRLGPYGFMCLDTPEVAGNQGLKDQVLALQWIKDNIEYFGGNSNRITIFGESAGAASVEFHLLSHHQNLFHQAILHSGSVFGTWVMTESDSTAPARLATKLGYQTDDMNDALAFLKTVDPKLLIAAANEIDLYLKACVEKQFDGVDNFLPVHPVNIDTISGLNGMPILTGFNSQEDLLKYLNKAAEDYEEDPFKTLLGLVFNEGLKATDVLRHFYIGDSAISPDVKWKLINLSSDMRFNHPVQRSLERFIDSGANVYQYMFAYTGERNFVKKRHNVTEGGAAHADELGYFFDMTTLDKNVNEDDQIIVDRVTTMWTNFVKHGNPTPEASDLLPIAWPKATKDTLHYLKIDKEMTIGARAFSDRMAFWDLFYSLNLQAVKGYVKN